MRFKIIIKFTSMLIILYVAFWIVIFIFIGGLNENNTEQVLWGIKISENKSFPEIADLIIWNLVSGIPILSAQFFMNLVYSRCIYLTLIRYKKIYNWHFNNLFIFMLIIICWYTCGGIISVYSNTKLLITAICLNIIYSFSIVILSNSVYLIYKNKKIIVLTYILITSVSLGFYSDNDVNKYIYGFWGMLNRSNYVNKLYGFKIDEVIIFMLVFIVINIIFQCTYIKNKKIDINEE